MTAIDAPRSQRHLFIGGEFIAPDGAVPVEVTEKATGRVLAHALEAGPGDVDAAVVAAVAAQPDWARRSAGQRAEVMRRAAAELERRRPIFEDWLVRETGSIRGKAADEVSFSIMELENAAFLALTASGDLIPSEVQGRVNFVERRPVGCVALITAFNFPLHIAMRILAPALALGNCVLLKPPPVTPFSGGLLIAELFEGLDLPPGVLSVLTGNAAGPALVAHPDVDMVHFTGSNPVGRRIAVDAAGTLKKVALELGGNNAMVVFPDANLERAVDAAVAAGFGHHGQVCIATSRHIVFESVAEEFEQRLARRVRDMVVGDPATGEIDVGPLVSEQQAQRVADLVTRTVHAGGRLIVGGGRRGPFHDPTVVTAVRPGMPLFDEEIFGPVAPITVVRDEAEALQLANAPRFALSASVFSGDLARAWSFGERMKAGMVHVNEPTALFEGQVPFGGVGESGVGERLGGRANLDLLTERRWLSLRRDL